MPCSKPSQMVRVLSLLTPLLALGGGAILYASKVVRALQNGSIHVASRRRADWVFRDEEPERFAFEVAFQLAISVGLSVLLVAAVVWTVRNGSTYRRR